MAVAEPILPYAIRQFEVDVLIPLQFAGVDVSLTVSAQAMVTTVILTTAFLLFAVRKRNRPEGRLQACAEMIYEFVVRTVVKNGGEEASPAISCVRCQGE